MARLLTNEHAAAAVVVPHDVPRAQEGDLFRLQPPPSRTPLCMHSHATHSPLVRSVETTPSIQVSPHNVVVTFKKVEERLWEVLPGTQSHFAHALDGDSRCGYTVEVCNRGTYTPLFLHTRGVCRRGTYTPLGIWRAQKVVHLAKAARAQGSGLRVEG